MDVAGSSTFGRYRLIRCLSKTSQGTVYLATDTRLSRQVALKMPNFTGPQAAGTIERFYREARLAAQIEHPNLCPVYDVDCQDGIHYLTMAYIADGIPLTQRSGTAQRWPSGSACVLVRKLALALQHMHDLGLVHRDVSAENVLLQPDGNPVLVDFGLASAFQPISDPQLTASYHPGTPIEGASEDLHALGALLYLLLTGEKPVSEDEGGGGTLYTSVKQAPRLVGIDGGLLSLCAQVLAPDPVQRPPSMRVFADRLQAFCPPPELVHANSGLSAPNLGQPLPVHADWPEPLTPTPTVAAVAVPPPRRSSRRLIPVVSLLILGLGTGAALLLWPSDKGAVELRSDSGQRILLRGGEIQSVRLDVQRRDLTGVVDIQLAEAVEGIELTAVPVPGDATSTTIHLRAAPTAPLQRASLRLEAVARKKPRGSVLLPVQIEPQSFRNSLGMQFALIPAGRFRMGANTGEAGADADEQPQREVEMRTPFYLGVHEVTQQEYQKVMGTNPSYFAPGGLGASLVVGQDHGRFPVESLTWDEAQAFCARLSQLEAEKGAQRVYRLPTEAEWEYACRGGANGSARYAFGEQLTAKQARFDADRPTPVGHFGLPNGFGLHDMHGNVAEWCADWYAKTYYEDGPKVDPPGPPQSAEGTRVQRGGAWNASPELCRTANRDQGLPDRGSEFVGLRVVCTLVPVDK